MRPIVTDRVAWSVGHDHGPGKTAEPIEIPFGLWTRVSSRSHVLHGGPDPPWERAIWRGKGAAHVKYNDTLPKCAKMAEQIKMPFGVWTHVGPRKHVLDGGHIGATWQI